MFDALPEALLVLEPSTGAILTANPAAARLFGYPVEELRRLTARDLCPEGEACEGGEQPTRVRGQRRKDGTTFVGEQTTSALTWGGRPALLRLVRDVTLHFNAFNRNPLLMSVVELPSDRYLDVNEAFCARTGYRRDEMLGRTAVELGLITPAERDQLSQRLMALIAAQRREAIDIVIRARDGSELLCRYWGEVLHTAQGPRLFAAAEDVTVQRKEALAREEALRQQDLALRKSNERFSLAMDATSDGLWDWDLVHDETYVSPTFLRLLGPRAQAAIPKDWRRLLHPDDLGAVHSAIYDCVEGRAERLELETRLGEPGEWRWFLVRATVLGRDERGRAQRLLGTLVDITERKRLQAGLAQSDRLASMGMLAAGVAHEINNPLAYVMASLDAVAQALVGLQARHGEQLDELIEAAQSALDGTRRIRKISRALSTFSRVERVELTPTDVNQALETAATMAQNEVKYRATLRRELEPVSPVLASEGKLAQVFLNLIINAAHAIEEGQVEANQITLRSYERDGAVFAEVADTGHGIAPENLERVFEPFFTTKGAGLGSGLGLPISRSIVTEFGGQIRLESEVGRGTRVIVRLPATAGQPAHPTPAPALPPETAVRGRILVVDDEALIRKVLARSLSAHHDVVTAASGREGKLILERDHGFDLVFCDLMMPEMTGMELHAWLATHDPALARRVIFISGGAFTPSAGEYLASVGNLKLEKPFDMASLLSLAAQYVLEARRAAR